MTKLTDIENNIAKMQLILNEVKDKLEIIKCNNGYDPNIFYIVVKPVEGCFGAKDSIGKITNEPSIHGVCGKGNNFKLINGDIWNMGNSEMREATKEEIESNLITEAKRKGFVEGAYFISCFDDKDMVRKISPYRNGDNIKWCYSNDELRSDNGINNLNGGCSNPAIYMNGKWADLIINQSIKIDKHEVNFIFTSNYFSYTIIDGHRFEKKFWEAAAEISKHSKAKVMIGCLKQFDVSLETINKILDELK